MTVMLANSVRPGLDIPDQSHLARTDLRRLVGFFHQRTGIELDESKRQMVESRLRRRLIETGRVRFADYVDFVLSPAGRAEQSKVIDCLTTHKTEFFREPKHFDHLATTILPNLLASRLPSETLKLWSAACSTGEEAYSIAMVVDDVIARHPGHGFDVAATDVSNACIDHGKRAIYRQTDIKSVPATMRRRYVMMPRDSRRQDCKIVPELRRRVRFALGNLVDGSCPEMKFDVIFLRNILIYFDAATQQRIIGHVLQRLHDGGHLLVGHAENITWLHGTLEPHGPSIYRYVK